MISSSLFAMIALVCLGLAVGVITSVIFLSGPVQFKPSVHLQMCNQAERWCQLSDGSFRHI